MRYRGTMPAVDRSDMLILFASIGSGHEMAAAAIEEQARAIAGDGFSVRRLDLLALMRFPRKTRLSAAPTLPAVGPLYDALWGATSLGGAVGRLTRLAQPALLPRFAEHIPAGTGVVVSTHALGAILTAKMPDIARVSVMTDLMPHAFWPREVDRLCAATPEARDALLGRGFSAEQLAVTGIPVRSQFAELPERGVARARLGLVSDRPVALLAAGADDPGPYTDLAHKVSGVLSALLDAGAGAAGTDGQRRRAARPCPRAVSAGCRIAAIHRGHGHADGRRRRGNRQARRIAHCRVSGVRQAARLARARTRPGARQQRVPRGQRRGSCRRGRDRAAREVGGGSRRRGESARDG